jgi:hyperosmotically inducible periplasmic protein
MNIHKTNVMVLVITAVFGLTACDNYGSAENVGEKIDITTKSTSEKMSDQAADTSMAIDDTSITTKVKSAILLEPGISSLKISVKTEDGEVTLTGTADTEEIKDKAQQIASNIAAVKQVNNLINVKAPS